MLSFLCLCELHAHPVNECKLCLQELKSEPQSSAIAVVMAFQRASDLDCQTRRSNVERQWQLASSARILIGIPHTISRNGLTALRARIYLIHFVHKFTSEL